MAEHNDGAAARKKTGSRSGTSALRQSPPDWALRQLARMLDVSPFTLQTLSEQAQWECIVDKVRQRDRDARERGYRLGEYD